MKKNYINPYTQDYAWGGALQGGLSQGASMAAAGMTFGPVGAAIGGAAGLLVGGITGHKKEEAANKLAREKELAQQQMSQSQYDAGIGAKKISSYQNSVNELQNPTANGYANGGQMGDNMGTSLINPTDVNYFGEGGSHEENPNGGIPQGMGSNGKMNTVEEKEVSIQMDKDTKYIFSDRLTYV